MALVEQLIAQISDPAMAKQIAAEVTALKKRLTWGLVFERHIPETTNLVDAPVRPGSLVWERRAAKPRKFRVKAVDGDSVLVVEEKDGAPEERVDRAALLLDKPFAEPVYPALRPLGAVRRGPADKPSHVVIDGENFHALQLLVVAYEGQADVLYLDPPYNTGAPDWKYNNRFVDDSDQWKHSKWLSFMEKRLALGRRLLKPDGVIVVTIDENEVHHLGMLLEQMFPDARHQMATICINPSGASNEGLSRVDEYAFFLWFGAARPGKSIDDLLASETVTPALWESLLRRGSSWIREVRPNLCYPVKIDGGGRIVGVGERFDGDEEAERPLREGDLELAWPVRRDGRLGIWRVDGNELVSLVDRGFAYATRRDADRGTWSIKYVLKGTIDAIARGEVEVTGRGLKGEAILHSNIAKPAIAKTVWHRGRHTAGGSGGTQLVTELTGIRGAFSYPKSIYAVRDALEIATGGRTDALIFDFFAGSGTTLHATAMLNAEDGGTRRCVLVTNNEVNAKAAARLNRKGHFRGDPEFESHGVFEVATRPRVEAAIRGQRLDGSTLHGTYLGGRDYSEGYEENCEFFRLMYLDPVEVELGRAFDALSPLWWLTTGGIGERDDIDPNRAPFALATRAPYGFLFDPSGVPDLLKALEARTDVRDIFITADSDDAFTDLANQLPDHVRPSLLYRPYLEQLRAMNV